MMDPSKLCVRAPFPDLSSLENDKEAFRKELDEVTSEWQTVAKKQAPYFNSLLDSKMASGQVSLTHLNYQTELVPLQGKLKSCQEKVKALYGKVFPEAFEKLCFSDDSIQLLLQMNESLQHTFKSSSLALALEWLKDPYTGFRENMVRMEDQRTGLRGDIRPSLVTKIKRVHLAILEQLQERFAEQELQQIWERWVEEVYPKRPLPKIDPMKEAPLSEDLSYERLCSSKETPAIQTAYDVQLEALKKVAGQAQFLDGSLERRLEGIWAKKDVETLPQVDLDQMEFLKQKVGENIRSLAKIPDRRKRIGLLYAARIATFLDEKVEPKRQRAAFILNPVNRPLLTAERIFFSTFTNEEPILLMLREMAIFEMLNAVHSLFTDQRPSAPFAPARLALAKMALREGRRLHNACKMPFAKQDVWAGLIAHVPLERFRRRDEDKNRLPKAVEALVFHTLISVSFFKENDLLFPLILYNLQYVEDYSTKKSSFSDYVKAFPAISEKAGEALSEIYAGLQLCESDPENFNTPLRYGEAALRMHPLSLKDPLAAHASQRLAAIKKKCGFPSLLTVKKYEKNKNQITPLLLQRRELYVPLIFTALAHIYLPSSLKNDAIGILRAHFLNDFPLELVGVPPQMSKLKNILYTFVLDLHLSGNELNPFEVNLVDTMLADYLMESVVQEGLRKNFGLIQCELLLWERIVAQKENGVDTLHKQLFETRTSKGFDHWHTALGAYCAYFTQPEMKSDARQRIELLKQEQMQEDYRTVINALSEDLQRLLLLR